MITRLILPFFLLIFSFPTYSLDLAAKSYYVFHPETGVTILSKKADEPMGPASLTKMMTLYMLFEAIRDGTVTLNTNLPISEAAWRKGGSKMFVKVGDTVRVEDLIRGIAVVSGNDACIVVAEYLAGSEEEFARRMTNKAQKLGMTNTVFANASGWPDPAMHTTARDMATLAHRLHTDFPQHYPYFAETSYEYAGIKQSNRNLLLNRGIGVDGLKTGHTEEAGYHLVSSAERNGTRLIAAVLGTESKNARADETQKALNYGFSAFRTVKVLQKNEVIVQQAPIRYGNPSHVDLVAGDDLRLYLDREKTHVDKNVQQPPEIMAPIKAGDTVAILKVTTAAGDVHEVPLVAAQNVEKVGLFGKFMWNVMEMTGL